MLSEASFGYMAERSECHQGKVISTVQSSTVHFPDQGRRVAVLSLQFERGFECHVQMENKPCLQDWGVGLCIDHEARNVTTYVSQFEHL